MKTELIVVTPALAREWLKQNTKNRAIRPSHVETLRQSFERGEAVTTHQGIAFDGDGLLIDGQHRLSAIALMSDGFTLPMLVTWDLDRATVFPVVDVINAKRSTNDVLILRKGVGEAANFLAKLYAGSVAGITPRFVAPFAAFLQPEIDNLLSFCNTSTRTWSSAPVRAGAVFSMKYGDADYTKVVYRALVTRDFDAMPRVAQSLFKAHMAGSVRASVSIDLFARSLRVFEPKNANNGKVQIKDISVVIAETKATLQAALKVSETPAPKPAKTRGRS